MRHFDDEPAQDVADLEQMEQENAIFPWLADDSMADEQQEL